MKKKPGIIQAERFILQQIKYKKINSGSNLPSIRVLAKLAEVSYVTMWKTIVKLREDGVIIEKGGTGKNVLANISSKSIYGHSDSKDKMVKIPEVIAPLWEITCNRMEKEILYGKYPAGSVLPSAKELQKFYRISFPTLKKTLLALIKKGIIRAAGKRFEIPPLTGESSPTKIAAFGCGWEDGSLWIDYLDKNYFRLLENSCIQSGIGLDMGVYYIKKNELFFTRSATCQPFDLNHLNVIGFVCIIANLEVPPETVINRLLSYGKPVAVIDVVGGWELPGSMMANKKLQIFTVTASLKPGVQAARYLLPNKHMNIAYISPFHKSLWSIQRLSGLKETFSSFDNDCNVSEFVLDKYSYQWDFLQSGNTIKDISSVIDEFEKTKKLRNSALWRKFGKTGHSVSKYLTDWNCASGEIYHRLLPFFKNALADKNISAWVMANDYSAMLALDFLQEQGVKVPEDLMMISFDNTREAMEQQLTSFDFNRAGLIHHILRYLLWPVAQNNNAQKKIIEVEGVMIERRSSGLNPKSVKGENIP